MVGNSNSHSSSSSRVSVVVVCVMVMTLAMTAAAYTGRDLAEAARDQQWGKVKEILSGTNDGLDLDYKLGDAGITAIVWASFRCKADIVRQLALAGADVNLPGTQYGDTALIRAAGNCPSSTQTTLRELISAGADLTLTDRMKGRTALHTSAYRDNRAAVPLLLEAGAPTGARDYDGLTPAQLARQRGNTIIAHVIENFITTSGATTTTILKTGYTNVWGIAAYIFGSSISIVLLCL